MRRNGACGPVDLAGSPMRACTRWRSATSTSAAASGPIASDSTASGCCSTASTGSRRRATSRTSAPRPAARTPRSAVWSSWTPTSTSGSRRSAGSSARAVRGTGASCRRGDRARRGRAGGQRLPELLLPGRQAGQRFENLAWDHELYCAGHLTQAAVAHARGRGDERLLGVARRFADHIVRGVQPDRDRRLAATRRSRPRSSSSTGTPASGATWISRAYFVDARGRCTLAAGALRLELLPGPRPGARGDRGRPATPCAPSTSRRAWPTSTSRPATPRCWTRCARSGATCPAQVLCHRRRWARTTPTRRSATRSSCRPTAATRETCAAIASVHVELADAARHRRRPVRRPASSARSTTASSPASRSTAAATPTSTRCTCATRTATRSSAARGGCRGSRAPAARRTSCGCWRASSIISRRRTPAACRSTTTRPASCGAARGRCAWPPTTPGMAASRSRSRRPRDAPWALSLRVPAWCRTRA